MISDHNSNWTAYKLYPNSIVFVSCAQAVLTGAIMFCLSSLIKLPAEDVLQKSTELSYRDALWTCIAVSSPFSVTAIHDVWRSIQTNSASSQSGVAEAIKTKSSTVSKNILKSIPFCVILFPSLVMLLLEFHTSLSIKLATVLIQFIFCAEALLLTDASMEDFALPRNRLKHTLECTANIVGYVLLWYSCVKSWPGHSHAAIVGVIIHSSMLLIVPFNRQDVASTNSFGDSQNVTHALSHCHQRLSNLTWQRNLCTFSTLIIWIIRFAGDKRFAAAGAAARIGALSSYVYTLACMSLVISVFFGRSLKDKLDVAKMAEELNRIFGRFISHELRSHISHLTLGLEMLDDYEDAASRKEAIMDLQGSCEATLQVLNDIIVFDDIARYGRGDTMSHTKSMEVVDLSGLLRGVVSESESLTVRKLFHNSLYITLCMHETVKNYHWIVTHDVCMHGLASQVLVFIYRIHSPYLHLSFLFL